MLSILIVTPTFPDYPGKREGNFVYDSVTALANRGVDVSVLVTSSYVPRVLEGVRGGKSVSLQKSAFPEFSSIDTVRHFSIPRSYLRPVSNFAYDNQVGAAIRKQLAQKRFDLIHGHGEVTATVIAEMARQSGISTVVSLHGISMCPRYMHASSQKARFREALNAMNRVIVVGEPLRPFFSDITGKDEHFRCVHNGFALPPRPLLENALERWKRHRDIVEFISVSNLHEGKGIDINLDALAELNRKGLTGWSYRIVGDGDQRLSLESQSRRLGLERQVEFLGARPHQEVYSLLSQADIFILPSYREAFGIAYLEAMAMGLLAVGVQGQGPEAFIVDGENGCLVPPKDADALAACLTGFFENPGHCIAMARRGQQTALTEWTWDHHATRMLDVYHEIL
jgi:glycosyltransferase involved in cell wall biosynthesis